MLHCRRVAHLRPIDSPSVAASRVPGETARHGAARADARPRPAPSAAEPRARAHGVGASPRPFLKWAGGKRQLLPELRLFYPRAFGTYFEPFVGSGAVFFDLAAHGLLSDGGVRLADLNADVIGCYEAVRTSLPAVLRHLRTLESGHQKGGESHYYRVRDREFNPLRRRLTERWTAGGRAARCTPRLAAMLVYLNRTGFNGLFRLNARGDFNVPAGRYTNPRICDEPTLIAAAAALRQSSAQVRYEPFETVLDYAGRGDFVYFDPPYAPLTATSRFTSYTEAGFGDGDQRRLQHVVVTLAERGCHVLLSNSTAPVIRELYEHAPEVRRAGLKTWRVRARRAINARAAGRGQVDEFLITNLPRRHGRGSLAP
jgi:DNA adenine methylase